MHLPTLAQVKAVVSYDQHSGIWTRIKTGKPTGTVDPSLGYVYLYIGTLKVYAHRLAWFWMTGKWPDPEVDHRDRDRANNRWGNLREASRAQNRMNATVRSDSQTKLKGVSLCRATGRYRADIRLNGKGKNLGRADTPEEAFALYVNASRELFGEFSAV